ncbi:hypothetical protein F5876DRAFT_81302 [Lentinula aff. lateritia]|uniref:Uncharacterized protein n=1 Tax=Lentinula aff. lateritia TaxID=2804960 RepID=A0ACC1TML6_9AGAR|nr:hypothetical protein F5876DRAFT_81302 [Lentinula aff. lateritia]
MFSPTPTSSTTSPAPTVEIIDGKIFAPSPEMTSTVTEFVTAIVTVLPISTSTSTVEVVVTDTVKPSTALPATTTVDIVTVTVVPSPSKPTIWTAPAQMTDLSAFNITNFAGGSQNLRIVDNLSANSSTELSDSSASAEVITFEVSSDHSLNNDSLTVWTNATSALQILYPENSIDPARKPQGGAEFYAAPLELKDAKNVTLEYGVFFPQDFDWVLGGKLPGLYGGRQGCSGGDAAVDCFSTRLMWRKDGLGELYLYAPKDKQTDSLCNDPKSVCDADYGLSIGRGSFVFAPGSWTHVRQTVTLNTPGQQDGCFTLEVNGNTVIDRNDVYYRGAPLSSSPTSSVPSNVDSRKTVPKPTGSHTSATSVASPARVHQPQPSDSGDLFGPGGLLGGILKRANQEVVTSEETDGKQQSLRLTTSNADTVPNGNVNNGDNDNPENPSLPLLGNTLQGHSTTSDQPPGFIGLFFSTFFGGHEKQYASPKDQLVWFKDFAMSNNG